MAAIDALSQIVTREWIDGTSIERFQPSSCQENWADLDFAEELYRTILDVFNEFWQSWARTSTAPNKRQVKETLARLRLWGRDFGNGKLAVVLAQSDELRDTVLDLLRQVGTIVVSMLLETSSQQVPKETDTISHIELVPHTLLSKDDDLKGSVEDLQYLIARSKLITGGYHDSDAESNDGDTLTTVDSAKGGQSRNGPEQGIPAEDVPIGSVPTTTAAPPSTPDAPLRLTAGLQGEVEQSSDEEEPNATESLGFHVDCLMDLVPSMEGSLTHVQSAKNHHVAPVRVPFTVSDLARPWVQNVSDKFERADRALVERLGESNWQRFVTIRARSEHIASIGNSDVGTVEVISLVNPFEQTPKSIFTPLSLFHDSGLGSSVPTAMLRYAASVTSHTSFVSSIAADGTSGLRVPPTPKEVNVGESFRCEICGHRLFNIKSRVDWK
ncbi:hypothetical protein MMC30_008746 [Trapelia coarctata]|nr:hypothetical protein [Trapelia coarctata]